MPSQKTVIFSVRITKAESTAIDRLARRARRTPSDFVRLMLQDKIAEGAAPELEAASKAAEQPAAAEIRATEGSR